MDRLFLPEKTRSSFLSRLRRKDEEGWNQFFGTYWRLFYAAALAWGLSEHDAQEVVQETMIGVVRAIPSYVHGQNGARFKTWLGSIVRHKIQDFLRGQGQSAEVNFSGLQSETESGSAVVERLAGAAAGENHWEADWNRRWNENAVWAAMDSLRLEVEPQHYEIFRRSAVCGHSAKQISQDLKVSPATIYTVVFRLRAKIKKLRARLDKEPLRGVDFSGE